MKLSSVPTFKMATAACANPEAFASRALLAVGSANLHATEKWAKLIQDAGIKAE